MLDDVFESKEIISYIFSVDYIYNFLQIKLICNEEKENQKKSINENPNLTQKEEKCEEKSNTIFMEKDFKEMFSSEQSSISLIKLGIDFKKRQKMENFSISKYQENFELTNFSNNFNKGIRKGSLNENFNYTNFKQKFFGKNSENFDLNINQSPNESNYLSKRKNTYTFGQAFDQSTEKSITKTNENSYSVKETENDKRSSSYESLRNKKHISRNSDYIKKEENGKKFIFFIFFLKKKEGKFL